MKKIKSSLAAKILAAILLTVFVLGFVAFAVGCAAIYSLGGYTKPYDSARDQLFENMNFALAMNAGREYLDGRDPEKICAGIDFRFEVYKHEGDKKIFSNYNGEPILWSSDKLTFYNPYPAIDDMEIQQFPVTATPTPNVGSAVPIPVPIPVPTGEVITEEPETAQGEETEIQKVPSTPQPTVAPSYSAPVAEEDHYYQVKGYFLTKDEYPNDEISLNLKFFDYAYANRYSMIWLAAASLLLSIISLVFLLSAAGHRAGKEGITPNFMDKIPYDIYFAALGVCICACIAMGVEMFVWQGLANYIAGGILIILGGELMLLFLMSTATRIKLRALFKNTLCWKLAAWCWNMLRKIGAFLYRLIRSVPLVRKGLLIYGALLVLEFFWMLICEAEDGLFAGWFVERLVLGAGLIYVLLCMKKLRAGAAEIASGNENHRIDTQRMYGAFKEHAEDLNNIGEGIRKAVDERMKSERFKTELITNVSHDIKTPLTSIVSYVDLLAKEEPENEKMREYIDVLSRQSGKLKKLTEDLVEASKASSGSLPVNFEKCALNVLLDQTAGEYAERLAEKNLELVLKKPEKELSILADGRHMWRVFDNLMNNICKYAQGGTRVYLSLEEKQERAEVSFKNISHNQLNISGDELMERFVRGDSSRNTEGSGLGLSIARSLVELQKGSMELSVDGDLFKVVLVFQLEK